MGKSVLRIHESPETPTPPSGGSRDLMIEHYHQHLRTSTNRNGWPYAPKTISGYMRCVRALSKWLEDNGFEGDLTPACDPAVLNEFFADYLASHDVNGAAFLYRNIRNLFRWLEQEIGAPNPYKTESLDTYTAKEHKPKVLSRQFIRELLKSCSGQGFTDVRDKALIRLMLEGLRASELLSIEIDDIPPLDAPVLRVVPSKGELRYAQGRRIKLQRSTVKATQAYLRVRLTHPLARTALRDTLWLGQASALPLTYDGLRLMLQRRCERLGYDEVAMPHMFRHTAVSDLLEAGMAPNNVAQIMGWSSLAMLARYGKDQAESRAIKSRDDIGDLY